MSSNRNQTARLRSRVIVALFASAVLVLGLATSANAATRMYTGTLTIQAFGNDTTTGTAAPQSIYVVGSYPWGPLKCNTLPLHLAETVTFTEMGMGTTTTWTLMIPTYGGQIPTYTNNGMSYAPGCIEDVGEPLIGACNRAQGGETFTGGQTRQCGTASTFPGATSLAPRDISLAASDLVRVTSLGSFSAYTNYIFGIEFADLRNAAGSFFEGGGPGDFSIQFMQGQNNEGKVANTAGPNQFGGVMGLLGQYTDREGYYKVNHIVVASYNWLFDALGASGQANTMGTITMGSLTSVVNVGIATNDGAFSTTTVQASAFPWTTGMVTVTATRGPFTTVQARTGYDNRTIAGGGTIQLVSPMLTRWIYTGGSYETAGIGVLNMTFVPEPGSLALLAAGTGALGLLYRRNRRR